MNAPVTKRCPYCAEEIHAEAKKCKHCGEMIDASLRRQKKWNPGTAAVLSFFIPGAGQIYKGEIMEGIFWFVFIVVGYVFILPGLVLHILCVMNAHGKTGAEQVANIGTDQAESKRPFGKIGI